MSGTGNGTAPAPKDVNAANAKLEDQVRVGENYRKNISRKLDALRRLTQLVSSMVIVLLLMLWLLDHPAMAPNVKRPVIGALLVVCTSYIAALEVARSSTGVVIFLLMSGTAASFLSLGYSLCWLHHHWA